MTPTLPVGKVVALQEAMLGGAPGGEIPPGCEGWNLLPAAAAGKIPGVTGVILAGGRSSRMGSDKALLPIRGGRFIESIYAQLSLLFDEVLVVTSAPEHYAFLPCRKVPDLLAGAGPLSGIHSALVHSKAPRAFVVGCDMPCISEPLVRRVAESDCPLDGVVVPTGSAGVEPLHALYGKWCLPAVAAAIWCGDRRIISFFEQVKVTEISVEEVASLDPAGTSFRNINTPQEYYQLREWETGAHAKPSACAPSIMRCSRRGWSP